MLRGSKPPIMGLLEQGGKAALKVAKHVSEKTVDGLMKPLDQGLVIDTGICKKSGICGHRHTTNLRAFKAYMT